MNKTLAATAAALTLFFTAGLASQAQAVYFSADIPVASHLNIENNKSDDLDSLSGYKLGLGNLVGWLGVGYEAYSGNFKPSGATSSDKIEFSFTDLLLDLPIPVVNITLGYGVGKIKAIDSEGNGPDWDATQQFINVGIPIGAVFDVHLGYHVIQGKAKVSTDSDADATTTTVGVRIGF